MNYSAALQSAKGRRLWAQDNEGVFTGTLSDINEVSLTLTLPSGKTHTIKWSDLYDVEISPPKKRSRN